MNFDKCEGCVHSRAVISENGLHYVCCLSPKKAMQCQLGQLDAYIQCQVMPETRIVDTKEKAAESWNRRANND